jgi:hypothetical protein
MKYNECTRRIVSGIPQLGRMAGRCRYIWFIYNSLVFPFSISIYIYTIYIYIYVGTLTVSSQSGSSINYSCKQKAKETCCKQETATSAVSSSCLLFVLASGMQSANYYEPHSDWSITKYHAILYHEV